MQNIADHCQQTFCIQKYVDNTQFEFSLKVKVMGLNPGYLLKSYLLYLAHRIQQPIPEP